MKVKVSQTLELDEVPELLKDILNECARKLDNCRNVKHPSLLRNVDDLQKFGTTLHELRSELSMIDAKLLDCWNISVGYDQALHGTDQAPMEADGE
jgi:hypothetical protein